MIYCSLIYCSLLATYRSPLAIRRSQLAIYLFSHISHGRSPFAIFLFGHLLPSLIICLFTVSTYRSELGIWYIFDNLYCSHVGTFRFHIAIYSSSSFC